MISALWSTIYVLITVTYCWKSKEIIRMMKTYHFPNDSSMAFFEIISRTAMLEFIAVEFSGILGGILNRSCTYRNFQIVWKMFLCIGFGYSVNRKDSEIFKTWKLEIKFIDLKNVFRNISYCGLKKITNAYHKCIFLLEFSLAMS